MAVIVEKAAPFLFLAEVRQAVVANDTASSQFAGRVAEMFEAWQAERFQRSVSASA
jgi:hypothetical protein